MYGYVKKDFKVNIGYMIYKLVVFFFYWKVKGYNLVLMGWGLKGL